MTVWLNCSYDSPILWDISFKIYISNNVLQWNISIFFNLLISLYIYTFLKNLIAIIPMGMFEVVTIKVILWIYFSPHSEDTFVLWENNSIWMLFFFSRLCFNNHFLTKNYSLFHWRFNKSDELCKQIVKNLIHKSSFVARVR